MPPLNYVAHEEGWLAAPLPPQENERLARLRSYDILDSAAEPAFDRVTELAATWFSVPFALVSLVDADRQWFKSCHGVDVAQTPRELSFCAHAIWEDTVMIVPDATKDERFRGNPLVTGPHHVRFYAGAPLITSGGIKLGTLCVLDQMPREVTEQDKRVLASLASVVVDEMELRIARLTAEEENEKKSQYVAYVSHEVRTPLSTIHSALALTRDEECTPETQSYLRLIGQATDILLETINDFLDIARLETHALELERISFQPDAIVEQVAELMRVRIKHGVALKCSTLGLKHATLLGDPTRVRQILMNFVGNAVKFTERGTIQMISSLTSHTDGIVRWRIEVQDSGIGIPAQRLPELFKKFQQAEQSISRRYGGSGLGLHICKQLAEMMGGSVGASSEPGNGSNFWFEAPFSQADKTALPALVHDAALPRTDLSVLLVEDDRTNHLLTKALLERHGYRVASAYNGREAVTLAEAHAFDVILMDCQMPEMDGFAATRIIRARVSAVSRRAPIIALTANALAGDRERCIQAGMDDYVGKPVTIAALQEAIRRSMLPLSRAQQA